MRRTLFVVLQLSVVASYNRLHAQCPDGSPPPCAARPPAARAAPAERTPSLSVLYLENISPDTADAALADGITEEVITRLSQVPGLRVTSRYAALRYRGRRMLDPRLAGRELGVRYVLQGTLRKSGDRVRVQTAVTEVATGFNVWVLQDSVAVQVAEAVRGRLTGADRARLTPAVRATTTEAYQAYLRGRAVIRGRTASAAAQAIAHYQRAVALDPTFAPGYAALAHAYSLVANWGWDLPGIAPDGIDRLALSAAARAIALDSSSSESWLGAGMAWRSQNLRRALDYNRRAVKLDSTNVEALHQLAWGFYGVGELDSAIATERLVTTRDPFYAYAYAGLAEMLSFAGHPLEALARAAQGLAIDSTLGALHWQMADANLHLGRAQSARAAATRGLSLGAPPVAMRVLVALAGRESGDSSARAELAAVAAELRLELSRSPEGLPHYKAGFISGAYAQLGETDSAIVWARHVTPSQRWFYALFFERHWFWEPVRGDPRFQAFLSTLRQ